MKKTNQPNYLKVLWYEENNVKSGVIMSKLPMSLDYGDVLYKLTTYNITEDDIKRADSLGNAKSGSGHDSYLKSATVTMLVEAPLYFWKQWDRYHFQDTISSSSTMHKIHLQDLNKLLPDNTYPELRKHLQIDIKEFNETKDIEVYNRIITNLPQGYLYTRGVTLNYLQVKSMYSQRHNHKLAEWRFLCKFFIDNLYGIEIALDKFIE